jgi:hypothetical protein
MVAGTDPDTVERVESVLDVAAAIDAVLADGAHVPEPRWADGDRTGHSDAVRAQLEDLGYM